MKKRISKTTSLFIILAVYILATYVGFITQRVFANRDLLISVFIGNIEATIVVWLLGVALKNSSVYDPYWSLAPIIIVAFWILNKESSLNIADILLAIVILSWGIRLTLNWIINWQGMEHIDWRYKMLKEKNSDIWQIVNLGGINIMPTVLVYLGLIPAYYIIFHASTHNVFLYIGFTICIICPIIQLIADMQMKEHRKSNTNKPIDTGLWRYSRHPNYFGEIVFWWGLYIMQLGVVKEMYISIIGAVFITLLFVFVSIPMMENHIVEKTPEYEKYKEHVSMLVPWSRK